MKKPERLLTWNEWIAREYPTAKHDYTKFTANDIMLLDEDYKEYGRANYEDWKAYREWRNDLIFDWVVRIIAILLGATLVFFLIYALGTPTDIHP